MRRIITTFPFTVYGLAFLVGFNCLMFARWLTDSGYEGGATGLMMFLFGMAFFGFPFYLAFEFLLFMNNGHLIGEMELLTVFIGLLICMTGDTLLWRYRSWKGRKLT